MDVDVRLFLRISVSSMIQKVPATTVMKNQVLAVERWFVRDGESVRAGDTVVEIEMIQLSKDDWMDGTASAQEASYPYSICSLQLEAQVGGVVRHFKAAGERIECGEPLFEVLTRVD